MNVRLEQIKRGLKRWLSPSAVGHRNPTKLRELAHNILTTRPDEIDCEECYERLDRFAERIATGESPSGVMLLVQDHLERCPDCNQEFLAIMAALQLDSGEEIQGTLAPWPIS